MKLPFAVPDPISEAEKETYESLEAYIQSIIVPDMQKRLRQGFGRAIRTETDTCVVSILDNRAVQGGKYHEDVLNALPTCQMAEELRGFYPQPEGRGILSVIVGRNSFAGIVGYA